MKNILMGLFGFNTVWVLNIPIKKIEEYTHPKLVRSTEFYDGDTMYMETITSGNVTKYMRIAPRDMSGKHYRLTLDQHKAGQLYLKESLLLKQESKERVYIRDSSIELIIEVATLTSNKGKKEVLLVRETTNTHLTKKQLKSILKNVTSRTYLYKCDLKLCLSMIED